MDTISVAALLDFLIHPVKQVNDDMTYYCHIPCQNIGTSTITGDGGFECKCAAGFSGTSCGIGK